MAEVRRACPRDRLPARHPVRRARRLQRSDAPRVCSGVSVRAGRHRVDAVVVNTKKPDRRQATQRIVLGYVLGNVFAGGLSGGLLVGTRGIGAGLLTGLGVGILLGFPPVAWAVRVLGGSSRPTGAIDKPLSPAACRRQDLRGSLIFGGLLALTVGITVTLVGGFVGEPLVRVLLVVPELAIMPFVVTTLSARAKSTQAGLLLFVRHKGPLRPIRFLEDARDRDVLRTAGSVYQFRHARLQDLLARSFRLDQSAERSGDGGSSGTRA